MKHLISACAAGLLATSAAAQLPPTCLTLNVGFMANSLGGAVRTSDGGYAICGENEISNSGYGNMLVTKLDASGSVQWMKAFDAGQNTVDIGQAVVALPNGELMVAGRQRELNTIFLMKLDADGEPVWTKTYDHPTMGLALGNNSLIRTSDGGFALHAHDMDQEQTWNMLRTDADGNVLWSDGLAYTGAFATDVAELPGGDLVFTGQESGLGTDLVLRKDGLTGTTEWMKWYEAGAGQYLLLSGLVTRPDSSIVVSGAASAVGYADAFAMALSANGTPLWGTRFGTAEETEYGDDVALLPDGGVAVTGPVRDLPGGNLGVLGGLVTRLDPDGQKLWTKFVSHPEMLYITFSRCSADTDGGILLTGRAASANNHQQLFVKMDADGNGCPNCMAVDTGWVEPVAVVELAEQAHTWTGAWATAAPFTFIVTDVTAIADMTVCAAGTGVSEAAATTLVQASPNPFSDRTVITVDASLVSDGAWIELRDVLGRVVGKHTVQGTSTVIERGSLPAGRYTYLVMGRSGLLAKGALLVATH